MNQRPEPIQSVISDQPSDRPTSVAAPEEEGPNTPLLTLYPTSYDSLSACAHIQYRMLMCKYKCGIRPSSREKQVIERAMRKVSQAAPSTETGGTDGFYGVDMEQGTVRDSTLGKTPTNKRKMSVVDSMTTVIFRFPLYIVFIVFIALHDVLFDGVFRHRVREAISMKTLDDEE